ncbi:Csu type fimbrial protein [Yersinia pekkanenii]|uniref:Spore coat U domain-containing protein n=1 Tax=Yersinia pekkanenii TaxID=1288385 RepID=A0A0T9QFM4_9GAMM|nr:spore coat protein U domain-containing protein [Yersinia pekkanenii]CNI09516.1 spore coat U domain-containing protein [Yersinia pekkanenii]CRY68005.1 spore coat U domain-containing protein [Yersinia pekkanenii]
MTLVFRPISSKNFGAQWLFNGLMLSVLWLSSIDNATACTFSAAAITLPSNSSFNVNTLPENSSGVTALLCIGTGVSLLSSPVLNATVSGTTNSFNLKNTAGDLIPYSLYSDAGLTHPVVANSVINYASSGLLSVTLLQIKANLPIYIRTGSNNAINVNVSAGTYTDSITLNWDYDLCATSVISLCLGGPFKGTATSVVTVTLEVKNDCIINNAPDVNFGSYALMAQFIAVNQFITATCTKNATFTTYITNGDNFLTPWPQMKLISGTDHLQYQLYQGAGSIPWNITNKRTDTATGTAQQIPYKAMINAQQTQRTS